MRKAAALRAADEHHRHVLGAAADGEGQEGREGDRFRHAARHAQRCGLYAGHSLHDPEFDALSGAVHE